MTRAARSLNEILAGIGDLSPAEAGLPDGVLTTYGLRAFTDELTTIRDTPEGNRNHQFNRSAFALMQLVASGDLEAKATEDALWDAALDCGLDRSEIKATLRSAEAGAVDKPRDPRPEPLQRLEIPVDVDGVIADADVLPADEPRQRGSWWPQEITGYILGTAPPKEPPAFLERDDGLCLFYPGKVNGLIGESESGKSWVALLACRQALYRGHPVTYIDFEDSAVDVVERMKLIGATPQWLLERFAYIGPETALDAVARGDLVDHLTDFRPGLVVMDGVNAAMSLLGLDLNDNMQATQFHQKLLKPVAQTGAAVVYVDHVPKSKDARGKGGIGAQAKRAMTDGCSLIVEVVREFGVGQHGEMKLTIDKDRGGLVRGNSYGAKVAGTFHLDSSTPEATRAWVTAPESAGTWQPTALMEQISRLLEATSPLSQTAVERSITGKTDYVRVALQKLREGGHTKVENGRNNALLQHLIKPYRDPAGGESLVSNDFDG